MNAIWEEIFSEWLTPQGVGAFLQGLLFIGFCMLFLFRKGIVKQLVEECGIATKKDLEEANDKLRTELLWKIDNLRAENKADMK
jgi:hypothetical protein